MPLQSKAVGGSTQPLEHPIDARWLMAYAASLDDCNPRYLDTAAQTVIGHPLFPVCLEWPVILNLREIAGTGTLEAAEAARGVHASHDLHILRPIRSGDRLRTVATMTEVRAIKPGAVYTLRLDTCEADSGTLVARTYQQGIYRGVAVQGADQQCEAAPAWPLAPVPPSPQHRQFMPVSATAAHTYTECARIWNPIHTDRAVALRAGLPDIILHGTATLAMAVSRIVDQYADQDPTRVVRLGGRFSAMVRMPSTLTLETQPNGANVGFRVLTEDGDIAISEGFVTLQRAGDPAQ